MKEKIKIQGGRGMLNAVLRVPELAEGQKCPLVVLMHGFMANLRLEPLKTIGKMLEEQGIASLAFDFNGHGKSEGKFCDMNVFSELDDAMMVYDYVSALDFVDKVAFCGHSQGGVVAGMVAAMLGNDEAGKPKVCCIVQLAPAAVLHDDALNGTIMGKTYDPKNPPDHVWVFFHKLGRTYIECAQKIDIYGVSKEYQGPVCLVHGTEDKIVPYEYGARYHELYANSELHTMKGDNHFLSKCRKDVWSISVNFLREHLA
ncbi:MAG: alpha/beta hydrolase [Bacteroidales bacterium]|nr:alpha/beta hydrolase [Bacteroidales bacterium]